jgi:two-component system, OmpR family, alkaline phosphatase synthesis response regulator PhoP
MSTPKQKILIAEDDQFILKAYIAGLTDAGFDVVSESDGNEIIKKVKSEKPDIILLDIMMPGKNGFDTLAELKMDDELKKIPVVILSNLGQESDVAKGTALGAIDYLVKSNLTMVEVVEKIKFHLALRK